MVWVHAYIQVVPTDCNYSWVINGYHAYDRYCPAHCSPQLLPHSYKKQSIAQRFAVSSS